MKIRYSVSDGRTDVCLCGELDTPATVEIQPEIDKLLEYASGQVVIDCSELTYIASSGLRQFITIHKRCIADGGHMTLTKITPDVMEILSVTNFDKVFDIK